ncbi:Multidrug resistance protein MdtA [bioreactor metagenome]|jgi:HlyD family secretion protein|uniref:Multidrug resistance protein MdtA n=1 Tax=bioreactor metagenome TaxID=1076179 RepID=A0A644YJQ8_9ZZZZ|nr:efflux RND transporter periplasmic adaptor subunit [Aminobacterium sp.]MEA4877678.1 efflux RND transporter periplasmic adaptor subunit [Aminobacterium sp.]
MKKWLSLFVLIVLISGAFFFFRKDSSKATTVETVPIIRGNLLKTVSATGSLQAVNTVNVGSQVSGTIKAIYVDFNTIVKKGELIAEIDPALLEAAVETAKADVLAARANIAKAEATVKNARKTRDRNKELFTRNLIAESELDTAQTELDTALASLNAAYASLAQSRANLKNKEINLGHTKINSPINGVIIDKAVEVGQTVNASQSAPTLFTIAEDLTQMKVEADIDEADIGYIKAGQNVEFTVDAYSDLSFEGKIKEIRLAPNTDGNIVTYTVIVMVENPLLKLMPGMTANVSVIVEKKMGVLKVSNAALRFKPSSDVLVSNGKNGNGTSQRTLWVYERDIFKPLNVTIGISDGLYTEISGEVQEGMNVVTSVMAGKSNGGGSPFVPGPRR